MSDFFESSSITNENDENMSNLSLSTPQKSEPLELCAVCLSPMKKLDSDSSPVIQTKCKHCFHAKCLSEVKLNCHRCPMCRTSFSPQELLKPLISEFSNASVSQLRTSIVQAAMRGRNAVQLALSRRANRALDE